MRFKLISILAFSFAVVATAAVSARAQQISSPSSAPEAVLLLAQALCRRYDITTVCVGQHIRFYDREKRSWISGRVGKIDDSVIIVNPEGTGVFWPHNHGALRNVGLYGLNQDERLEKGSKLTS